MSAIKNEQGAEPGVSPDIEKGDGRRPSSLTNFWQYLGEEVDPLQSTAPLGAFSFMTGFLDAMSFTAVYVWCGFQTGNFIQLALAIARLWEGTGTTFRIADQQALASLLSFNAGAFLGRIGDHIGPKRRIWLIAGTFLQTLFTMAASIAVWKSGQGSIAAERGDPSWSNVDTFVALCFMSASLGLQGIVAKRLNTQFGTTIVLTTIWVELMSDPHLFKLTEHVRTRDHRLIAAGTLFLGGFTSRALLAQIGSAKTLAIGTGLRFLVSLAWIFVPGK
ncbi:hypothetical protein FISHEDRAFT_43352 [Fistulina hepatica ATCC 64428]|uniref:DUF1275 domain protein n=1 Tax=Fistulina hepatica ATCC 64428 TaxID=1128425 RepID=A0A0D7AC87_9AGAR|nr:hypothetical protein FISHEDRAFT_43352 [Fistulina hepatica ATCC 64428]